MSLSNAMVKLRKFGRKCPKNRLLQKPADLCICTNMIIKTIVWAM